MARLVKAAIGRKIHFGFIIVVTIIKSSDFIRKCLYLDLFSSSGRF